MSFRTRLTLFFADRRRADDRAADRRRAHRLHQPAREGDRAEPRQRRRRARPLPSPLARRRSRRPPARARRCPHRRPRRHHDRRRPRPRALDGAGSLRATVSCGVASSADGDPIALVAAADAALYAAKRAGKNRTVRAGATLAAGGAG